MVGTQERNEHIQNWDRERIYPMFCHEMYPAGLASNSRRNAFGCHSSVNEFGVFELFDFALLRRGRSRLKMYIGHLSDGVSMLWMFSTPSKFKILLQDWSGLQPNIVPGVQHVGEMVR